MANEPSSCLRGYSRGWTTERTLQLESLHELLAEVIRQRDSHGTPVLGYMGVEYGRLSCLIWDLEHSPYIGLDGLED